MKNFVFLSPNFPTNYWKFCKELKENGMRVLGIGDEPYEQLDENVKNSLHEYYKVGSLENYDEVYRGVAFLIFKHGQIDWLESNNEYWLERDAKLRTAFHITSGFQEEDLPRIKYKSKMKEYYQRVGIPTARYHLVDDLEGCQAFIEKVGYPVVVKPDNGVGAASTYKLKNETELEDFLKEREEKMPDVPYIMEEFIEAAKTRGTYSLNVSGVGDWDMYPYFWLFGGVLTDDGFTTASGYLDSDASIAAMQKIVELHDEKVFTIRDVDGSVDAWDGINSEYAMFFEGPWYFGSYDDCEAKGIVAATIPTYEGRSASVVGGEDIAVFSTSEQKDAAYEFAKFMTSEEVQLAMLQSGQLPILKSLVENEAVTSNPVWSVYMKQMESAKARIPSPNNSAIQEIWSEMVTSIFVEGTDAAQAMHDAAARIDEQLT